MDCPHHNDHLAGLKAIGSFLKCVGGFDIRCTDMARGRARVMICRLCDATTPTFHLPRARKKHSRIEPRGGSGHFDGIQRGFCFAVPFLITWMLSRGTRRSVPTGCRTVFVLRGLRPTRTCFLVMPFLCTRPYEGGGNGTGSGIGTVLNTKPTVLPTTQECPCRTDATNSCGRGNVLTYGMLPRTAAPRSGLCACPS